MKTNRFIAALVGLGLMHVGPSFASNHPLAGITNTDGVAYTDQVVALDWDLNNPPTLNIDGTSTLLDRAYITNILNAAADRLYTATEGKIRLGKVSIYDKSQYLDNTDHMILNKPGRANAHVNGFMGSRGARDELFTQNSYNVAKNPAAIGATMVHEMGHYVFSLYDEYKEVGNNDTSSPSSPQDRDTPRNTLMHDQAQFKNFSTVSDYSDPNERQTAHYRWFGRSAWETLVNNPDNDGDLQKPYRKRIWFEPFKTMQAPTADTLTKPENGVESRRNLLLNYVSGSNTVLVIDRSVSAADLEGFKNAAQAALKAMSDDTVLSLVTFINSTFGDGNSYNVIADSFPLSSAQNRATINSSIESLTSSTSGSLNGTLDITLAKAATIASPLAKAQDDAKKLNQTAPLSYSIPIPKTPIIQLFTTSDKSVSDATKKILLDGSVLLNAQTKTAAASPALAAMSGANPAVASSIGNLAAISTSSGGRFLSSRKDTDLSKNATNAANEGEGELDQTMTTAETNQLSAGSSLTMTTPISNVADGEVTISGYVGNNTGITMTLVGPGPVSIDQTNASGYGITYSNQQDAGVMSFTIPSSVANRNGNWISKLTASSSTTEGLGLESTVKSNMTVETSVSGGTDTDHDEPLIVVILKQPDDVTLASVSADIYNSSDVLLRAGLVLKDDGIYPDMRPDDGNYSASLSGLLPSSGVYASVVSVSNANLQAKYGTKGALEEGVNLPPVTIGANFVRMDELEFNYTKPDVSVAVEDGVPSANGSGTGDGNGDGIPDSQQNNVTSLPAGSGGAGAYETIESTGGITLNGVSATTSPSGLPSGIRTPYGALSFTASPVTPGATESFKLYLPYTPSINAAYKQNQTTGDWMNVATSITSLPARNPTKTVISFALKDGGPFDADRLANGSISDPIIPAIAGSDIPTPPPTPVPTLSEWAQLIMMLLMLASAQFYGRKMMK